MRISLCLEDEKRNLLTIQWSNLNAIMFASVDVLFYRIKQFGKKSPIKSSKVNLQERWKQFPNITKWKQWNIYTPEKPAIFNDGNL